MGTVSIVPLFHATSLQSYHFPSTQTFLSNVLASPHSQLFSFAPNSTKFRRKSVVFGKQSRNPNESQFLDEDGALQNMDGYLNYLSLEYDSVWDTKPSWLAFHFGLFFFHPFYSCFLILNFIIHLRNSLNFAVASFSLTFILKFHISQIADFRFLETQY